jgi:hypothetical protein
LNAGHSAFAGAVFPGETVELERPTPNGAQFRVFQQGATGFVSIQTVREGVQKAAAEFCAAEGMGYRRLSETHALPPYIPGNFPRVELVFECLDWSHPRTVANDGK